MVSHPGQVVSASGVQGGRWVSIWSLLALTIAAGVSVPLLAVLSSFLTPAGDVWRHLWQTQLLELILNTLGLLIGVGVGTVLVGTGLAWLVVYYRFPGQTLFEWGLILPLAIPAYVLGFVCLGLFDFTGPLQTLLRGLLGAHLRLPTLRSYWGVTLMMTLVFYPYVYLLARAAFLGQGATALETARSLGRTPLRAFLVVTLPMARPALVAGGALAMMEALADVGTVATFGYRTLTEAIYRVWYGMFDRPAATQLASGLLGFALLLLLVERLSRGRARYIETYRRGTGVTPTRLHGWRAGLATGACLAVLGPGFLVPVGQLGVWTWRTVQAGQLAPTFGTLLGNTVYLATLATAGTCLLALVMAYASRLSVSPSVRWASQCATMGYALPGSVVAVGVLLPLAWLDHTIVAWLAARLGQSGSLLFTGSAAGLLFAYLVRFLAVSLQTVDASLTRISPSLDDAARSLGAGTGRVLRRIHLPLLRSGVLTALILVFVEVMKEMPATLLLRPFGLNTLAIEVWQRTADAMWQEAAAPALAIVGAGILPVLLAVRLSVRR
ncbi:MAG: iron ABC transporter permease [Candidatus Tectomicrobia bacterium]|uniref:Iron ABC transporter permease n=1 Tax=Tectimicrobiota bacterium TaxID=2528274 RepID=A0A937VZX9_UNCTE|nr:iron ABC transporter permease [Candidatus Tectomicrobia bacterium]